MDSKKARENLKAVVKIIGQTVKKDNFRTSRIDPALLVIREMEALLDQISAQVSSTESATAGYRESGELNECGALACEVAQGALRLNRLDGQLYVCYKLLDQIVTHGKYSESFGGVFSILR